MDKFKELREKYESQFTFDEPIQIKNQVYIYPVSMENYFTFLLALPILKIKKNNIPDETIIQMSYLEFIIRLINDSKKDNENKSVYEFMLTAIIELCLHYHGQVLYGIDSRNKSYLRVGTTYLNSKDFDTLKDLILLQNLPNYKADYIDPDLEKELAEADRIRNAGYEPCNIEKQIMAVVIGSSLTLKEVKELSIRKFMILLEMIDKKLHYVIMKQASMSGMVKFKEDIKHYLVEDTRDDIERKIMYYDALEDKINGAKT